MVPKEQVRPLRQVRSTEPPLIRQSFRGSRCPKYQRARFALFIKILFKHLDKEGEKTLLTEARTVVSTCSMRHRMRDPKFSSLIDSVEVPLRELVGEVHWRRSHAYLQHFLNRRVSGLYSGTGYEQTLLVFWGLIISSCFFWEILHKSQLQ